MFCLGGTVATSLNSTTDDVPVGQGVLTATSPRYEVRDLRWRSADMTRSRLWFEVGTRVEAFEGQYMLRLEWHARDNNLLNKWFPR
jgi:hypothetical protein